MLEVKSKETSFREFYDSEFHGGDIELLKDKFKKVVKRTKNTGIISGIIREYTLRDEEEVKLIMMYSSPEVKMNDAVYTIYDKIYEKYTYVFMTAKDLYNWIHQLRMYIRDESERICYRLYDYQLYMPSEVRNAANPALPAIHSFERFKMSDEYIPVQGRIQILNPSGKVQQ